MFYCIFPTCKIVEMRFILKIINSVKITHNIIVVDDDEENNR